MPAPFKIITDGVIGDVPVNFYPASDSERGVILQPTPGKLKLCTLPDCTEIRGLYASPSVSLQYFYAVAQRGSQSVLWRIDDTGGYAELGTITTSASGPVWMVNNPTQLGICDGVSMYVYVPSTGVFVQVTDLDFPGASSLDYQDGYGLFSVPNTNQWGFTALNDFTSVDALDFYSKESRPDNIVALFSFMREPYILGSLSAEVWYNAGGDNSSASYPTFARNTGGVIEHGCGAAGTPNTMDGMIANWLSNKGQWITAAGYAAKEVPNQMFDRAVKGFSQFSDARCFSYRDQGHVFSVMNFPAGDQTWVLDWTTQLLHKRQSYKDDGSGYGRDRANCYCNQNNKHYVGDYSNGTIYEMNTDYYDEDGHEIQRTLHTIETDGGMQRLFFPELKLLIEAGVGLESGLDPQIMQQHSGDGGHTWSTERWVSAGKIGEYRAEAQWNMLGSDKRRMNKFTMTDPVLFRILGIDERVERG